MKIHQLLPCLRPGDGIGNHTIEIQRILKSWGHQSSIFAVDVHDDVRSLAKPYQKLKGQALQDALVIYHFSIGSELSDLFRGLPNKKILIYHNITPGEFLRGYDAYIQEILDQGRDELHFFLDSCNLALCDSEFNRQELEQIGFKKTGVLPIILDFEKYSRTAASKKVLDTYDDDWKNILFVGRICPNKCQEDVILAFYLYKTYINPKSRLFLVGMSGIERYDFMLEELVNRLPVEDVHFTGLIDDDELAAYYQLADLLLCMSEHEGFSVPMVESMHLGIPILAHDSSSIPHTLGGAGVLFHDKHYEEIAEMMDLLITDQEFRTQIIEAQRERLEFFKKPRLQGLLQSYIDNVMRER